MITSLTLTPLKPAAEAGSVESIPIRVLAEYADSADEAQTIIVTSMAKSGGLLGLTEKGPFDTNMLAGLLMPRPDPGREATRLFYVRPGQIQTTEAFRARVEANANVEGRFTVVYTAEPEQDVKKMRADGLYGVVSSFFDSEFEDDHMVSAFWDAMSRGAEDLQGGVDFASASSKMFQVPIFTPRRWERFEANDGNTIFDEQIVRFENSEGGNYLSTRAEVSGWYNGLDNFYTTNETGPSGYKLQPNVSVMDAADLDKLESAEGSAFIIATGVDEAGVSLMLQYDLEQSRQNVDRLLFKINAKSWSAPGNESQPVVELWNSRTDEWDEMKRGTLQGNDSISWDDLGFVVFEDVIDYVDQDNTVFLRVRASKDSIPGGLVWLWTDIVELEVGTFGRASADISSPAGTVLNAASPGFQVRDSRSGDLLTQGVDYFITDAGRIVWGREIVGFEQAQILFDATFPYVVDIDETVVAMSQLVMDLLLDPRKVLMEGKNFVIRQLGKLRLDFKYSYPGDTQVFWSPKVLHDDRVIYKNFGTLTARMADESSSELYLRRVQGIWYAFWMGPSVANVESGAQILLNAPFAFEESRVERIAGNTLTLSSGQVAVKPGPSKWSVVEGESVRRFAPLTKAVRIVDRVSQPGFLREAYATSLLEEQMVDSDLPLQVGRAVVDPHFFTAELDGFALAAGGATANLVRTFLSAIKPVYTFMGLGVSLAADCGEIVEGPCGYESTGNCFCVIIPRPHAQMKPVASGLTLDCSELLQRNPRPNTPGATVDDFADLPASATVGETRYVRGISDPAEEGYYVWNEPQKLPQPDMKLGHYRNDSPPPDWSERPGYPIITWDYRPEVFVEAGLVPTPHGQWQYGGRWFRVDERIPVDLPLRTSYKASMDVLYNPDRGTTRSELFSGTAFDKNKQVISAESSDWVLNEVHDSAARDIALAAGGAGTIDLDVVPVVFVKRIRNTTRGEWIPKHHFTFDRTTGRVTFKAQYRTDSWDWDDDVYVDYRTAYLIDDLQSDEAGYDANDNYSERAKLELVGTIALGTMGKMPKQYDEAYDLDGDFPAARAYSLRISQTRGGTPILTDKLVHGVHPLP